MNDRDRLIELLDSYYSEEGAIVYYFTEKDCKKIADYLLENGVIVLPCKVGDTVYELKYYHCCTNPELDFYDIDEKSFGLDMLNKIGKTVFLTREEAEQALKERENNA